MDEIRSRRVVLLSNGVAETEAEGSHDSNVADETVRLCHVTVLRYSHLIVM